ncbi:MAG: phosphoglucosamine mutase [Acidimicrobiales bacterium]
MLRFGTDGVRGLANVELTPELVMALGRAAARVLAPLPATDGHRRRFVVGRDTRLSGPLLQAALSAGLASEGVHVVDVGVLPTPGVAHISVEKAAPAAVISASHNPYWDNGVKFFGSSGSKLADDVEAALEHELASVLAQVPAGTGQARAKVPARPEVGTISTDATAARRYEQHLLASLGGRHLGGLRVVLDCANGAASQVAPKAFQAAGANLVAVLGDKPDGTNINQECGSTDTAALARAVTSERADLGLALDGDADRLIAVDAEGAVVDGDSILALFATDLAARGELVGRSVVVTVMTNLGFHRAMQAAGVYVHTVNVGDRYVLEALDSNGWALGGEQSGHVIFRTLATTGDGVLTGLLLADLVQRNRRPLGELAGAVMQRLPQVLRSVPVKGRDLLGQAPGVPVWKAVREIEKELGDDGRVLLRPSGTEPVVRVMVEAPTEEQAEAAADRLVAALHAALGDREGVARA